MIIQYLSDLHLERYYDNINIIDYNNYIKKHDECDIICLAGDICSCVDDYNFSQFTKFLDWITKKFKHVIHIPGNHEYYNLAKYFPLDKKYSKEYTDYKLSNLNDKYSNYYFLNNNTKIINDVLFIGTTLWTHIGSDNNQVILKYMNDFKFIYTQGCKLKLLTIEQYNKYHEISKIWLQETLKNNTIQKIVLITHHKPFTNKEKLNNLDECFEVDIDYLFEKSISIIYGHTHDQYKESFEKDSNYFQIVSNPIGYTHENILFDNCATIEI
jgi:predicted phosphohydrolase